MFHSQGQKSTDPRQRCDAGPERALALETKHLWEHTRNPEAFGNTPLEPAEMAVRAGLLRPASGPCRRPESGRRRARRAPAPRRRPAPAACRGPRRATAAPCRSWCTGRAARPARTAAPRGSSRRRPPASRPGRDATSIAPTSTSLPASSADQLDRHVRVRALERHLVDRRPRRAAGTSARTAATREPSVFFQSMLALMP